MVGRVGEGCEVKVRDGAGRWCVAYVGGTRQREDIMDSKAKHTFSEYCHVISCVDALNDPRKNIEMSAWRVSCMVGNEAGRALRCGSDAAECVRMCQQARVLEREKGKRRTCALRQSMQTLNMLDHIQKISLENAALVLFNSSGNHQSNG